ncbi:hypothetical protein DL767_006640 [Monosporascus sp. MG133]|nr:hypothetical protein DL767_006640 [Monosporascus sp. MG133]
MARTYLKKATAGPTIPANQSSVDVPRIVKGVIDTIRRGGDAAVRQYSEKFDNWSPESFKLSKAEIEHAISLKSRRGLSKTSKMSRPTYIPGGRYPLLASAHMTILTAKIAGVKTAVACTPPDRGNIPYATVAAMHFAGVDEIFILGGIQAIAAMAVGTETVPKVNFIAGPGNAFVAEAKRQLYGEIGIDLFAGPTEILIVADETADPFMVATDLLSQAEHGPDSPAVLITTSEEVGRKTIDYCGKLLEGLVTAPIASVSWGNLGEVVLVDSLDESYQVADEYASEHVQILTAQPREALEKMNNYGALFLGPMTCVSYGDKCIGTNHVLPTRGASKYTGGLWVGVLTHDGVVLARQFHKDGFQIPASSLGDDAPDYGATGGIDLLSRWALNQQGRDLSRILWAMIDDVQTAIGEPCFSNMEPMAQKQRGENSLPLRMHVFPATGAQAAARIPNIKKYGLEE